MVTKRDSGTADEFTVMGITVTVDWTGYSDPGRLYGPPEDCYPPESELEITEVCVDGEPVDYDKVFSVRWIDELEEKIWSIFGEE